MQGGRFLVDTAYDDEIFVEPEQLLRADIGNPRVEEPVAHPLSARGEKLNGLVANAVRLALPEVMGHSMVDSSCAQHDLPICSTFDR